MSARTQRSRRYRKARREISDRHSRAWQKWSEDFHRNADPEKVQAAVDEICEGMRRAVQPFLKFRQFADADEPQEFKWDFQVFPITP